MKGYHLQNHVFRTIQVQGGRNCDAKCYMESNCISFNVVSSQVNGTMTCELSDSDHELHPGSLTRRHGSIYQPIEVSLLKPCTLNYTRTALGYSLVEEKKLSFLMKL